MCYVVGCDRFNSLLHHAPEWFQLITFWKLLFWNTFLKELLSYLWPPLTEGWWSSYISMTQLSKYTFHIPLFLIEIFIFLCEKKIICVLHNVLQALKNAFNYSELVLVLHQLFYVFYLITFPTQCLPKWKSNFSYMSLASGKEVY